MLNRLRLENFKAWREAVPNRTALTVVGHFRLGHDSAFAPHHVPAALRVSV